MSSFQTFVWDLNSSSGSVYPYILLKILLVYTLSQDIGLGVCGVISICLLTGKL